MKPKPEKMWAISMQWEDGRTLLYCDTAMTRSDMISKHCSALGKTWKQCRRNGDRAIKVMVKPL